MNCWANYGYFVLKGITLGIIVLGVVAGFVGLTRKRRSYATLQLTDLNKKYQNFQEELEQFLDLKRIRKSEKKIKDKKEEKPRLFVLDFKGNLQADAVESLREEISAILTVANSKDRVLLRLESGGGTVHGYGLAASQLQRLKGKAISLTVAVDKVAASGGYLMACVADWLIAAPFAVLGSIGVVAQLPNFNRFLKKHQIDFEQITAGDYKRTLSLFGENTTDGREKLREELASTHQLFKQFIKAKRPQLEVESLATGETWYGTQAYDKKLVDEILTSDDFLMRENDKVRIIGVSWRIRHNLVDKWLISLYKTFNYLHFY